MRRNLRLLYLALTVAALLCVPAYAAEDDPVPDLGPEEEETGIFQCGAFSGPQTLPGASAVAEGSWVDEVKQRAASGWEEGWASIRDEPLSQEKVYFLDIEDLNIYYPNTDAGEDVRQSYETFKDALDGLVNDDPERFFYSSGWWFENKSEDDKWFGAYDRDRHAWVIKYIRLKYQEFGGLTGAEAERRFRSAVDEAMEQVDGVTGRMEQLLLLHDYIVSHVSYNYERSHDLPAPTRRIYGAYGLLVDGDAVCNGYTLAYKVLLNRLGIPNLYVVSDAVDGIAHAWNLVELGGNYYHVDTTWDDGAEGASSYRYFLQSDETFKENHKPYNTWSAPLPAATSKTYESGWFFNGARSSLYRYGGKYYAVRSATEVFSSDSLHAPGSNTNFLGRDLHIYPGGSYVWDNGCLYYLYWDSSTRKTLMAYHLDTSHDIQVGSFDSQGETNSGAIGLRCENGKIIPIASGTKGRPELDPGIPLLPASGLTGAQPVVQSRNDRFPLYYHSGRFYAVNTELEDIYIKKLTVTASGVLGAPGENPDGQGRNLCLEPYHGVLWLDGYLYYIDWTTSKTSSLETLLALQLDTGRIVQVGQFDRQGDSWFGLRYDEAENRVTAYRSQGDLASFPALPAGTSSGITVFDGGDTALAWAAPSAGQTLWTARYTGGRMTGVGQEVLEKPETYWFFGPLPLDGVVVPLRQGSGQARVFLLDSRWAPLCPAA